MKEALLSTAIHTLELIVLIGVVYLLVTFLNVPIQGDLLLIVLAALTKFTRTNTFDYVNSEEYESE